MAAKQVLVRYVTQLEFMEPRFPDIRLDFPWTDTFSRKQAVVTSLAHEEACALFNTGAVLAALGKAAWDLVDGQNQLKLKEALEHFRDAAGAFKHARELAESGKYLGTGDLGVQALQALENVCIGQANECVLAKAVMDKPRSAVAPKVAIQIAEYYDVAYNKLLNIGCHGVKGHPWRLWPTGMRLKAMHYRAVAQHHASMVTHDKANYGEEVAWLLAAADICQSMVKVAKDAKIPLGAAATAKHKEIADRRAKAEEENNSMFFEKVVEPGHLPEIERLSPVMPCRPKSTEVVADIFKRLVPMSAHLGASEYSESTAVLSRQISSEIAEKDIELEQALKKMGLEAGAIREASVTIPTGLYQQAAMLRDSTNGIGAVEATLAENLRRGDISAKYTDELLRKCKAAPSAPPAFAVAVQRVLQSVEQACRLDREAMKIMEAIKPDLLQMAGPADQLRAALEASVAAHATAGVGGGSGGGAVDTATARLEELLGKVKLLRQHRTKALLKFRTGVSSGDITAALVGSKDSAAVIASAMEAHHADVALIRKNFASQAKILPAIVEANAKCSGFRRADATRREAQEQFLGKLQESYVSFTEIKAKAQKGAEFYLTIDKTVSELAAKFEAVVAAAAASAAPARRPAPVPGRGAGGAASSPATGLPGVGPEPAQQQSQLQPSSRSSSSSSLSSISSLSSSASAPPAVAGKSPLDAAVEAFQATVRALEARDAKGVSGFDREWAQMEEYASSGWISLSSRCLV
jgi:tyrosine-protein phosphatase non-receptor type 23